MRDRIVEFFKECGPTPLRDIRFMFPEATTETINEAIMVYATEEFQKSLQLLQQVANKLSV